MPPNLGGFFMVRSYYPSECHADYFDFERIEALKPAIEACGISTLSQSPMLGFHKQMDNRIKPLEEILSFRMQGVEFDNGDMYVDGHKAASDVRDEFVSVTEKLMDELAQCYNVLPQLDINNTIDQIGRAVQQECRDRSRMPSSARKKKETDDPREVTIPCGFVLACFVELYFVKATPTPEIYTLSLHDALPIYGHKAASDVRDEFVSVTEKLMDELAQCYNVLPQLDINNTIDHRPEGDEKWFLENEKTVTQFCRKLAAERPLKDIR